ncbi:BolA family protein [Xanthobacter sp. TB0139]|uniref:BolA family protein n=1 Tax=Xanthobacter sp. TB0139 TaxID=3459178 RepID=UPI00403983D3
MPEIVQSAPALVAIRQLLQDKLSPQLLELEDESHKHAGHAGVTHDLKGAKRRADGGITHLRVRVVADAFTGKSRLERHRMVNALLQGEIDGGLHALAIEAKAPGE